MCSYNYKGFQNRLIFEEPLSFEERLYRSLGSWKAQGQKQTHWTLTHWTLTQELVHSDAVQALAGGTISAQACIESKFFEIAVV